MAKIILGIQYFILGLVVVFSVLVSFYVFKLEHWYGYLFLLMALALVSYIIIQKEAPYTKIVTIAILSSVLLNGLMNAHFYPKLLDYQGGSNMAEKVQEKNIPVDHIYKVSERYSWSLDFYNKKPVQIVSIPEIAKKKDVWIYATEEELNKLKKNGIAWDEQITVDQFRITRLQIKFLNPDTREDKLNKMHLVHLD
mgnify:FL=1